MLALRPYQTATIEAVRRAWHDGVRRPAVVLPTGAGKTVILAHLVREMYPLGVRSMIIVHRDELIRQTVAKLKACAPGLRSGVVKAARREIRGRDVIVASIQTLARSEAVRAELKRAGVRLVIVDEAHHAVADSYMKVLRELGCFEKGGLAEGAAALGVTATLGRSDRVALGQVWESVAYRRSILDMIREGFLVNARGIRVKIDGLDLSQVARSRGDWRDGALGEAMHAALAPKAIARAYVEHAGDRQGIAFTPTVELAHELAEALEGSGVPASAVDGAMALPARRDTLSRFARGDVQVVTNCMVLTEGFDAPWCSAVVIARPTSSAPLYIQMAGRGLRPHPGKRDALILDVAGVTGRHKLASVVDLAGADRVEELPEELAEYDEIDLLGLDEAAREASGAPRAEEDRVDGPLTHEIVDLFGLRREAWLRTRRGVWFLSVADKLIFLAPGAEAGTYSVARCETLSTGGEFLQQNLDLEMAMSWGEQYAAESSVLTRRGAAWRRKPPSQGQTNHAVRLGLDPGDLDRGQLSDAISTTLASERLDAMPCVASVSQQSYS
jgi:superfamily II DNA or RNA helicase